MYSQSRTKEFRNEDFKNPSSEFRGAPFWSWNHKLDKEQLLKHIEYFEEMGMGGFHIHCRTGLDTPYLEEDYNECVKACVKRAKEKGMFAYLYDEDRWPSGAAGGKVTKDVAYRSRYLVFTPYSNEERIAKKESFHSSGAADVQGNGKLLAKYAVVLENGYLKEYHMLDGADVLGNEHDTSAAGTEIWYLYEEIAKESPWYNNETYVDTLNKKAIERFIEETHEVYLKNVGDEFGKTVPSIFTDEPQFPHKTTLSFAEAKEDVVLPYTDALPDKYKATYHEDFFQTIPELIWDLPDSKVSLARYRFHDIVAEMFSSSFADTIGAWCEEHGIMLTGHMMEEPTLCSQTSALGEAMRSYRGFALPGIDMLCDSREYTTAKQAQSATHQFGRQGVLSELYGVTNWDFDFRGHKLAGDWQAALGITLRVHHLSWDSMKGEAKRDYPASIFYQSPWYKEYKMMEDHFARVNTALTRGKPHVRIGVIHPVESYWLHFGPKEQTALVRDGLEEVFENVTKWLLFAQLDFDYISESLLPIQYKPSEDGKFHVGEMQYDAVIVPGCETLRSTTADALGKFMDKKGDVLFIGEAPKYIDAAASDKGIEIYRKGRGINCSRSELINALDSYRDITLRNQTGSLSDHHLYQMREDGDCRWLFVVNGTKMTNPDMPKREEITFKLSGSYKVHEYDTLTGEIRKLNVKIENNATTFTHTMYEHDSVLLKFETVAENAADGSGAEENADNMPAQRYEECEGIRISGVSGYRLEEPNVLLLDRAEYRLDNGEAMETEEILRLDNKCREILSYPLRMEAWAQPWTGEKAPRDHMLDLKFHIESEIEVTDAYLALEELSYSRIYFNGEEVDKTADGYFVDEDIKKIKLPRIPLGKSEILVKLAYSKDANPEWYY